jgi:hypothetical protein
MALNGRLNARAEETTVANINMIAERTGLDDSEVIRRLVRLGLQDVAEIGDEVLLFPADDADADDIVAD